MNWTQDHRRCFALLAGVCIVGLLLAGCEDKPAPPASPTAALPVDEGMPVKDYPKDTPCVVCKETLGAKGDPIMFRQGAVPVIVCSKECVAAFQKDPAKYRSKP